MRSRGATLSTAILALLLFGYATADVVAVYKIVTIYTYPLSICEYIIEPTKYVANDQYTYTINQVPTLLATKFFATSISTWLSSIT